MGVVDRKTPRKPDDTIALSKFLKNVLPVFDVLLEENVS
jgi:hypothetical protein